MSKMWVVVADRARARILSPSDEEVRPLSELIDFVGRAGYVGDEKMQSPKMNEEADLVHPKGRLQAQEVHSDRQGQLGEEAGRALHRCEPATDYPHKTAEEFAGELCDYLTNAHREKKFERLGIVAAPLFLGVLRQKMPANLRSIVGFEIDKDLTRLSPTEIRQRLDDVL